MPFENIISLIIDPKQVFGQERPKGAWLVSIVVTALAAATLTLADYVAFQTEVGGLSHWLTVSLMLFLFFAAAAFFYLPVVHLLAERFMLQSKASDLIVYTGLSLSPLLAALPIAFFSRLSKAGAIIYFLAVVVIFIKITENVVSGVSDSYKISRGRALWFTLLPGLLAALLPLLAVAIAAFLILNG